MKILTVFWFLIMTLLSPVQVTSASFQLTFCAMFGLVLFSPLARRICPSGSRIVRTAVRSAVLTFGVQLGILFPELLFFQRFPLLVFLINLPATALFAVLILLFWLAALLLPVSCLSSLLSGPLSSLTGILLSGVRRLGSLPGLTLWIHKPGLFTAVGIILIFLSFCMFFRLRGRFRATLLAAGTFLLVLFAAHSPASL